jgi:hypothetical protein
MSASGPATSTGVPLDTTVPPEEPPRPQPPEEPHLRGKKRSSSFRTVGVWTGLILATMLVFTLFDGVTTFLPVALIGGAVGYVAWWSRKATAFNKLNNRANDRFLEGDAGAAARAWEDLARDYQRYPGLANLARYNIAVALQLEGEPERSLSVLGGLVQKPDQKPVLSLSIPGFNPEHELAVQLARGFALVGDEAAAARWLKEAEALDDKGEDELTTRAQAEVIVRLRQGRFDDALRVLDDNERRFESKLNAWQIRWVHVMRAFAAARGEPGSEAAKAHLSSLSAKDQAAFSWLAARWPEMRTFLQSHELL